MAIVSTLKALVPSEVSFIYADLNKANVLADNLSDLDYPLMIMLPINVIDRPLQSGMNQSDLNLAFYLLDRIGNQTIDFDHETLEAQIIEPCRAKARKFLQAVKESDFIDWSRPAVGDVNYTPTYSELDRHTAGVFVQTRIPIMEGVSGCE